MGGVYLKIIDISTEIMSAPAYDLDPKPKLQQLSRIELGDEYNLSALYTSLHTGTHIDAPKHFIEDGKSINEISLDNFVGPCTVLELPKGVIAGVTIDKLFPKKCERLLIKSGGKAHFMTGAAEDASMLGYKLIGTDSITIGKEGEDNSVHRAFLNHDLPILEGLNLNDVQPGEYFLVALPVKIQGTEASLTRAILIEDHIFWSGKKE